MQEIVVRMKTHVWEVTEWPLDNTRRNGMQLWRCNDCETFIYSVDTPRIGAAERIKYLGVEGWGAVNVSTNCNEMLCNLILLK